MPDFWKKRRNSFARLIEEFVIRGFPVPQRENERYSFDYAALFLIRRTEQNGPELDPFVLMQKDLPTGVDDGVRDSIDSLLALGKYRTERGLWRVFTDLSTRTRNMMMGDMKRLVIDPATGVLYLSEINSAFLLLTCCRNQAHVPYTDALHHRLTDKLTDLLRSPPPPDA